MDNSTRVFENPIKRELWKRVQAMNATWTRGKPDDLVDFFHARMIAITPFERHRRQGREACVAGWRAFAEEVRILHWCEINPCIELYGEAAVVSYDYEITFETQTHLKQQTSGRDLFFFIHEDGVWRAVADQFSAHPA